MDRDQVFAHLVLDWMTFYMLLAENTLMFFRCTSRPGGEVPNVLCMRPLAGITFDDSLGGVDAQSHLCLFDSHRVWQPLTLLDRHGRR